LVAVVVAFRMGILTFVANTHVRLILASPCPRPCSMQNKTKQNKGSFLLGM